jgi:hypothetical protein
VTVDRNLYINSDIALLTVQIQPTASGRKQKLENSDFDKPKSHDRLAEMIDNYEPNKEGIMTLITSYSNATFFVTYRM